MKKISENDLFSGLLGYGLFAEKIPKFLTSKPFLDYVKTKLLKENGKTFKNLASMPKDYVRYTNMRNVNIPRGLSIPEPFAYAHLCLSIKKYWYNIIKRIE